MIAIFHIAVCRKPISESTVAANVAKYGVGGLNIDGCRIEGRPMTTHSDGSRRTISGQIIYGGGKGLPAGKYPVATKRFPANLIHDGSDEVVSEFPKNAGGGLATRGSDSGNTMYGGGKGLSRPTTGQIGFGDSGSAARFFKKITT